MCYFALSVACFLKDSQADKEQHFRNQTLLIRVSIVSQLPSAIILPHNKQSQNSAARSSTACAHRSEGQCFRVVPAGW